MNLQNEQNTVDFEAKANQRALRVKPLLKDLFMQQAILDSEKVSRFVDQAKNLPLTDLQCLEAILRMGMIRIHYRAFARFINTGMPTTFILSERCATPLDSTALKEVEQFEHEHNGVVYAVIRSDSNFGEMDTLLFVGNKISEWDDDRKDIANKTAYACVINHRFPDFPEFGIVSLLVSQQGFLIRTA